MVHQVAREMTVAVEQELDEVEIVKEIGPEPAVEDHPGCEVEVAVEITRRMLKTEKENTLVDLVEEDLVVHECLTDPEEKDLVEEAAEVGVVVEVSVVVSVARLRLLKHGMKAPSILLSRMLNRGE